MNRNDDPFVLYGDEYTQKHVRDMIAEANRRLDALRAEGHEWDDPTTISLLGLKFSVIRLCAGVRESHYHNEGCCTFFYTDGTSEDYETPAAQHYLMQYLEKLRAHCIETGVTIIDYTWRD